MVFGQERKLDFGGKGRKKRIVRGGKLMRTEELAKRKIVSSVKSRLSKTRKPVWPQPEPNKTPLLKR